MSIKPSSCYLDTETMGLYGPMVIMQLQFDADKKPWVFNPWNMPVFVTQKWIEEIVKCRVVAHNLTFDWQKVSQFYNAIKRFEELYGPDAKPINHVDKMAKLLYSERSRYCLRPAAAVCTLLLCQKQIGGAALATKEVRVRKLTPDVAPHIAQVLNDYTEGVIPDIMFARRQDGPRWVVADAKDEGTEWRDVVMKFAPSSGLKAISKFVLGDKDTATIGTEILPPDYPYEIGYAPYAVMLRDQTRDGWFTDDGQPLWPELLQEHLDYWTAEGTKQIKYALDDVVKVKRLDEHLGKVDTDFDSEIACQVASVRVAGMDIDVYALEREIRSSEVEVADAQINVNAHLRVKAWITECLDDMEVHVIAKGCTKSTMKAMMANLHVEEDEECCEHGCPRCDGQKIIPKGPMPVLKRVAHVLKVRLHKKRIQLFDKLKICLGCFPSFRVIGTKSGRMSGADKLNYHGVDSSNEIRAMFVLDDPHIRYAVMRMLGYSKEESARELDAEKWVVCGGDMNSQELAVAAEVMNDPNLADEMREGKSLHGVFASDAFGVDYDQIMLHKDDKNRPESEWYKKGKISVYAILYGAGAFNISRTIGCSEERAELIIQDFFKKYPDMANTRSMVKQRLEAIRKDEDGRLRFIKPEQTYIDSVFGYRRTFDCEYAVMDILFNAMRQIRSDTKNPNSALAQCDLNREIIRKVRKGRQKVVGTLYSAVIGCALSLQGKVLRAALNHLIQSAGRTITLRVQKRIWDETQPVGIHPFELKLMSVHDEVVTASPERNVYVISAAVESEMGKLSEVVPLLSLDWVTDVKSWFGVKAGVSQEAWDKLSEEDRENAVLARDFIRCGWDGE